MLCCKISCFNSNQWMTFCVPHQVILKKQLKCLISNNSKSLNNLCYGAQKAPCMNSTENHIFFCCFISFNQFLNHSSGGSLVLQW